MEFDLCSTCKHFVQVEGEEVGECRRYPPHFEKDKEGNASYAFPFVHCECHCGEYSMKESHDFH